MAGPCIGPDCPECVRYMREGWTCPIGTLMGDLGLYLRLLHDGERLPNGFWSGDAGFMRGSLLLRYAVLHIVGIKSRGEVIGKFGKVMLRDLRLESWRGRYSLSYFEAIDAAFPEYEIFPWEMQRVPKEYWNHPGAGLAALRWFLDKQGWTARECYEQLTRHASKTYGQLTKLRLSWLCENQRIFTLLASCDPMVDTRPARAISQERKQKKQSLATLQCPICDRYYERLQQHFIQSHPECSHEYILMLGRNMPLDTAAVRQRMSQGVRQSKTKRRRASHLVNQGLIIPVEKWPSVEYVALEMNEWAESLEVRPVTTVSQKWTVTSRVRSYHEGSIIVYIPRQVAKSVRCDTVVRSLGQDVISLRFKSDEARQAVWEWYQRRASRKRAKPTAKGLTFVTP